MNIVHVHLLSVFPNGDAGQIGCLMLVGRNIGQVREQFIGKRGGGRRIQHDRDIFFIGIRGNQFVDLHGDFHLEHHHIIFGDGIFQERDVLRADRHIGAGNDNDAVSCGPVLNLQLYVANGGICRAVHRNEFRVNACFFAGGDQTASKIVVSDSSGHCYLRAKAGRLNRLVCSLSARRRLVIQPQYRFPRIGEVSRLYDQVHHKTANDKYFRFS